MTDAAANFLHVEAQLVTSLCLRVSSRRQMLAFDSTPGVPAFCCPAFSVSLILCSVPPPPARAKLRPGMRCM